jgi:pyruvate/2-oxoglutarate dehydrogenase complex dihydrolipoamide dehydrogenase (E3) component
MSEVLTPDICVIGAGTAGLVVSAGASQLGVETVLIEADRMGGDCLNTGCVPSKALLAAAHAATTHRRASAFGLVQPAPEVDFAKVMAHVHGVIESVAPNDSQARFEGLGVRVIREHARFAGPREVATARYAIRARRFVIATGASPAIPPIPGLSKLPYLTNETVFELNRLPAHLLILGGGPVGCELAQAFCRLGARVSLVEMANLLPKDDPELVAMLRRALIADGIALYEHHRVLKAEAGSDGVCLSLEGEAGPLRLEGSHLLVATGRRPRTGDLGLDAAGISASAAGIAVDSRLRTTNRRVYALGDVIGGPQFTHLAAYHAGIVIRNALFRVPARVDLTALPWVTYTDPEIAHVGLSEGAAAARGPIRLLRWPLAENDRARTEHREHGAIKLVTTPKGRILGADIAAPGAGEMIHLWTLAVKQGLKVGTIAGMIAPYPTLGEIGKRAAGNFFLPQLFGDRSRRLVRLLARLG